MSSNNQLTTNEHFNIVNDGINSTQENNLETTEAEIRVNAITASFASLSDCGCTPVCPICPTGATGATGAAGTSTPISINRIYITNPGSDNVSVIDGLSNTVIATVTVGLFPIGVGVNP